MVGVKRRALVLSALMVFSVFAGTVALSGTAAAANKPADAVTLESDTTYFQGQVLFQDNASVSGGETLELRTQGGTFVTQLTADSDGNFTIDTSTVDAGDALSPGFYKVEDSDGNVFASNFEIVEQSFNVVQSSTTVNNGGSSTTKTTWQSNRGDYEVAVTATIGGDVVTASDIDALTDRTAVDTRDLDGDGTVEAAIFDGGDGNVTWDFDGQTPGDYNVNVAVTDTTASGSATVTVNDIGDASVSLVENTIRQNQGDIAFLNVSFTNTDTAYLAIGGSGAGYTYNATVTDVDGDGYALVQLNTYTAGSNRGGITTGPYADGARGADTVTMETEDSLPSIIAQGDYEIGVTWTVRSRRRTTPTTSGRSSSARARLTPSSSGAPPRARVTSTPPRRSRTLSTAGRSRSRPPTMSETRRSTSSPPLAFRGSSRTRLVRLRPTSSLQPSLTATSACR